MRHMPEGTFIHNVELKPGKGGQLARSAGVSAQILGIEDKYVTVRLALSLIHISARKSLLSVLAVLVLLQLSKH